MVRVLFFVITLFSTSLAAAQTPAVEADISDKALRTLKSLVWRSLPAKISLSENRFLEIDKSDPSKIVIPDAVAREVVRVASLTARAHKCDLQGLAISNRDALLSRERSTGRWTESQLQYIDTLHLFSLRLLVGKVEAANADRWPPVYDSKSLQMPSANTSICDEQEKRDILTAIQASQKLVGKL
jgi:hypothetical protein